MVHTKDLIKASLEMGRDFLRPPQESIPAPGESRPAPVIVPIRSLGENHRERIAQHLLALDDHDRYLRFGYAAQDEQIRAYADSLDFERDEIFGIYNRRLELIAMAHLAYGEKATTERRSEFGVSVLKGARGKGFGARLFERAALHATNDGISLMLIYALSENTAMLKIARNAGATVEREGSESEAYLRLPPATLDSKATEFLDQQIALTDYRIKQQAKNLWSLVTDFQEVRRDTIEAQKNNAS